MRTLYIDIENGNRTDSTGATIVLPVEYHFQLFAQYEIHLGTVINGQFVHKDASDGVAWKSVVDDDWDTVTTPLILAENADIDSTDKADGILIADYDCDTTTYETAIGTKESILSTWELFGYNAQGKKIYDFILPAKLYNAINPSEALPPPPYSDYYTKTQVDGMVVGRVLANNAITPATKTKITFDAKGLVTGGADATTADVADSTDRRYLTDAQKTVATQAASGSQNGYLSSADWTTFNGKANAAHNHAATDINSGTLDGDRLPGLSSTKKGGVPATGTPSGKYLKDDGTWGVVNSATWGNITGTLGDQTDLANALNAKASSTDLSNHASATTGVHGVGAGTIAKTSDIPALSSTTPANLGIPAIGTETTSARADHVHAMPSLTGGIAVNYLFCDDVIFPGTTPVWHELEKQSDGGAMGTHTATGASYSELDRYVTAALGSTIIPAGLWRFELFCAMSAHSGQIKAEVYRVNSAGAIVGSVLGTAESAEFTNTSVAPILASIYIAEQSSWTTTDRIGVVLSGKRIGGTATLTFYHNLATGYLSNVSTPVSLLHNQLSGLNDADYQHLTAARATDVANATNANTVSTIVKRDASGNFSAGTITANLTGNASGSSGSCTGNAATATKATNLIGGNNTTLLGAIPYQSNTDTTTLLAPNTTTTKNVLTMTGTGTNGAAPAWGTLTAADVGALASSGTPTIPSGATATTQAAGDNSTKIATTAYVERQGIRGTDATSTLVSDDTGKIVTAYYSNDGGIDSYTKVMLHFNGTNDSTTITDSVASPHTWECKNTACLKTATNKFGGASLYLDGTKVGADGSWVVCTSNSSDWDFGSDAWTIDFWIYPKALAWVYFSKELAYSNNNGSLTMWSNGADVQIWIGGTGENTWRSTSGGNVTVDQWNHIAWTRTAAGVHNIYINGTSRLTWTNTNAIPSASAGFTIGGSVTHGNRVNAYIDEFRISKGIARTNFTPTPPTIEYSDATLQQYIKSTTKTTDLALLAGATFTGQIAQTSADGGTNYGIRLNYSTSPPWNIYHKSTNTLDMDHGTGGNILSLSSSTCTLKAATVTGILNAVNGIQATKIYPVSNSTTALQLCVSGGSTAVMTIDTTNSRVGIGTDATAPLFALTFGNGADRQIGIIPSATDVAGKYMALTAGNTVAGTSTDNVAGGELILASGKGTGTGASTISFQTATTGSSGKTLQTLSTKMTILGNGNVGIGITAPIAPLHIYTTWATGGIPFLIDDNNGYGLYTSGENTLNFNYNHNANDAGWINWRGYQNGTTRFRSLAIGDGKENCILYVDGINASVDIGTTTSSNPLRVYSTSNVSQIRFGNVATGGGYLISTDATQALLMGGAEYVTGSGWTARATTASGCICYNGTTVFYGDTGLTAGNVYTPTTRVNIDTAGKVGIGCAPDYKLHTYQATGTSILKVQSASLASDEYTQIMAHGTQGGHSGYASIGVRARLAKNLTTAWLELSDSSTPCKQYFLWVDSGKLYITNSYDGTGYGQVGDTGNSTVVGTQT